MITVNAAVLVAMIGLAALAGVVGALLVLQWFVTRAFTLEHHCRRCDRPCLVVTPVHQQSIVWHCIECTRTDELQQ